MNQKSFIIGAILAAAALSVIASPLAFATTAMEPPNGEDPNGDGTGDTSTTSTDQSVKQKNIGSGESINSNCGQNLYKAGAEEQECDLED